MTDNAKLIAEVRNLSDYVSEHIPGSRYKPMIDRLTDALEEAERKAKVNYGLYKSATADLDEAEEKLGELEEVIVELKPAGVLVEGSYFPVDDLPNLLGSYMRAAARYAREAKKNLARAEKAERRIAGVHEVVNPNWWNSQYDRNALLDDIRAALTDPPTESDK